MIHLLAFLLLIGTSSAWAQEASSGRGTVPLRVNSFLVEEAFTQEAGVVEHISTFRLSRPGGSWEHNYTQEWPLFSAKHQISFTLPFLRERMNTEGTAGIGDAEVGYGYQLIADDRSGIFVAPRLNLVLPTGDARQGRGVRAERGVHPQLGEAGRARWRGVISRVQREAEELGLELWIDTYSP